MRLLRFLDEYDSVKTSKDQDFPFDKYIPVLVFNDRELYIKEGITHGLFSHAIKHFMEYMPEIEKSIFQVFTNTLKKYSGEYYLVQFSNKGRITKILQKNFDIKSVDVRSLLTTLDIIQDKTELGRSLHDVEKEVYNILKPQICKRYEEIAQKIIDNAYSLTDDTITLYNQYSNDKTNESIKHKLIQIKSHINKHNILKFNYNSLGRDSSLVYNFNDSTLIVLSDNEKTLLSMYKMKKSSVNNIEEAVSILLNKYTDIEDYIKIYFPNVKI